MIPQREKIIVYLKDNIISKIPRFKYVIRKRPSLSGMKQYASTQFPLVAIIGYLPKPVVKKSSRTGAMPDLFISALKIDLVVYAQDIDEPDSLVSYMANDLWAALYLDPTFGGLVIDIDLDIFEESVVIDPYVAFKFILTVKYKHDKGGI